MDGAYLHYICSKSSLVSLLLVPFAPMILDPYGDVSSPFWAAENPIEQDRKNRNKNHENRN